MKTGFTWWYPLVYLAGAAIFLIRYRGTRALVPGSTAFLLLAMVQIGRLTVPRPQPPFDAWPGAASVAAIEVLRIMYLLGVFCLVGTLYCLANPTRGSMRRELVAAIVLFAISYLIYPMAAFANSSEIRNYFSVFPALAFLLAGIAIARRSASAIIAIAGVSGFAVLSITTLTEVIRLPDHLILVAFLTRIAGWLVVLCLLLKFAADPRVHTSQPNDFPPVRKGIQALRHLA